MHYSHIGPYNKWGILGPAGGCRDGQEAAKWDAVMRMTLPIGDATLDGAVDFADFEVVRNGWGKEGALGAGRLQWRWECRMASDLNAMRVRFKDLTPAQREEVEALARTSPKRP